MERKFASVQKVVAITSISNYDRVELATVLGWNCIVKKNDFKVGDLVIYFEPDSLLYPHIEFAFLEKRKYKIKTIKMCGVYSQGLILPLKILSSFGISFDNLKEGDDLTNELKIKHMDQIEELDSSEENSSSVSKKGFLYSLLMRFAWFRNIVSPKKYQFPTNLISKTDETNIQTLPTFFLQHENEEFYITEKLEGQSATYILLKNKGLINRFLNPFIYLIFSKNVRIGINENKSYSIISKKENIEEKLTKAVKEENCEYAIQGEIIGPRIQKNIYKLSEYDFYVFNVKNLTHDYYLNLNQKINFCNKYGFKLVPILEKNVIWDKNTKPEDILKLSNGFSVLGDNILREGYVIRSMNNDKISFKARSPEYLNKDND